MKTTLLRAGALSCALLASTALVTPAQAQSLPRFNQVDGNGVDLVNGDYFFSMVEGSIGSGDGALSLVRNWAGSGGGWTDNWSGTVSVSSTQAIVSFGTHASTFARVGSTFTALNGDAATFAAISGGYRYTAPDGTQIDYRTGPDPALGAEQLVTTGCPSGSTCGIPVSMRRPSGMTYAIQYDLTLVCAEVQDGACNHVAEDYRWSGVSNSANYAFTVAYASDDPGDDLAPTATAAWHRRAGAQFTNLDSAPASLPTVTYSAVSSTVTDVTDSGGQTWRFTNGSSSRLTGIRRPGAGSDTTSISYGSGGVTSVTNEGVATSYAFSTSGTTRTAIVTDANSQVTTVVSDLAKSRITSVTDPLSRATSFAYDTSGRLTQATAPEGNYVAYTYDARGNVTETRAVAKSGTSLPDMVTTASYDSACSNPVKCNQPNSVTDARGNVTDYTYDSSHGGLLTATAPAPGGSGDRPQTRYSYTQVTAVTGQPVYMLTGVSACASGTVASSCAGTTSESRQVIAYDTDNLRTTSITARNGDNSLSATSAMTYDEIGNLLTVDGPLSGSTDTTRYRYNTARQVVGVAGPDPDGGGGLHHPAVRTTYTNGLQTKVEQGNVNSQSDADWASFSASREADVEYDANARPVVQRLASGGTTYQLTQTSYDSLGRAQCSARRMNPSEFATASLPADACTLDTAGSYGPDRITRRTFDNAGQLNKVETGYGVSGVAADEMTITYRNNGQVETVTDAGGNKTTYVYDGHDRLSRTRMPHPSTAGTSSTTDYEELSYATAAVGGNTVSTPLVSSRRLRDGSTLAFSYDALNRMLVKTPTQVASRIGTAQELTSAQTRPVYYAYDLLGRLTEARFDNLSGEGVSNAWNGLGQLTSSANSMGGTSRTLSYQYDLAGNRTRITHPDSAVFDQSYDGLGRPVLLSGPVAGTPYFINYAANGGPGNTSRNTCCDATYFSYDSVQRLSALVDDHPGTGSDVTTNYSRNPAAELSSQSRTNDSYAFTGHANANVTGTANGLNQLTALGGASLTYDPNGNLTGDGTNGYVYDVENRLVGRSNGNVALVYDPLGRLYQVSSTAGATQRFLYDGDALVAEYDGSGTMTHRYLHGVGTDEPVVQYDGASLTTARHLFADRQGSIVAIGDGTTTTINSYDEYGVPAAGNSGRFQYTGQIWLPELGMYYYKARLYNPAMGRFMQPDPIGFGGGMNLYSYVRNDPTNARDPSGTADLKLPGPVCTGTRIVDACGGGGLGTGLSGFSTGGVGGRLGTGAESLSRLGIDMSGMSNAEIRALAFDILQFGEWALANNVPRDAVYTWGFGQNGTFYSLVSYFYAPGLSRLGIGTIHLSEEAYQHIEQRHGPTVTTAGHFDPVFFSMGREGFALLFSPVMNSASAGIWTNYSGTAPRAYELYIRFPYVIGGTGTYRGHSDLSTHSVLMRIVGFLDQFGVVSAYPIRD